MVSFTHFTAFVFMTTFITTSHAKHKSTSNSMVLGLTHSRTLSLSLSPMQPKDSKLQVLDVLVEPLKENIDGYLISLNLGSPPQQVIQVFMDTGSDLTWVPCGNLTFDCIGCDDYGRYKLTANYSPSHSSSCLRDLCTSPFCIDIHSSDNDYDPCTGAGCSLGTLLKGGCARPCPSFSYTYGAGGVVIGTLTRDTLRVHGKNSTSEPTSEVSNFCFGCVGSSYRQPYGIVGFGRGRLSLPSQLGFLQQGFSHCFLAFKYVNNPNITSPLVLGDLAISSKEYLQFTPMLTSPMYPNFYYIGLEAITVANSTVIEAPSSLRSFDSQGNGGMLIDSGTTYTHLPEPLYSHLLSVLALAIAHPRAAEHEDRTGFDLCYKVPCLNNSSFFDDLPSFSFHFLSNVTITLPKESYFYPMGPPNNSTVVKCLLIQAMDDGDHYGPSGVFGNFQQHDIEVVYDLNKERIGFQPMDCASYAVSHQGLHGKHS